jgi:hypothetical protein
MTVSLIDDQLLGQILRGQTPSSVGSTELYTSGYWYVRLCQAVLGANERPGVLSRPFSDLPPDLRTRATQAVLELPAEIGLLSLRELAPTIALLRRRYQLNILGLEALAVAVCLQADVFLSANSPLLEAALASENLSVTVGT